MTVRNYIPSRTIILYQIFVIFVNDGILSVADYNSTRVGVVVVVVVVVVVIVVVDHNFKNGLTF